MSGIHATTGTSANPGVQFAQCMAKKAMGGTYWGFEMAMASMDAAARMKAVAILADPALQNIQFSIPTAKISTKMLKDVLSEILAFKLGVRLWHSGVADYSSGIAAKYDANDDTLYVDLNTKTHFSKTNVVHEAVHAAHDLFGSQTMSGLASETVAYITECVFQLNKYPKTDVPSLWYDPGKENDVYKAAWLVAEKVLGRGGNTSKTTNLETSDLTDLQNAIIALYGASVTHAAGFNGLRNRC